MNRFGMALFALAFAAAFACATRAAAAQGTRPAGRISIHLHETDGKPTPAVASVSLDQRFFDMNFAISGVPPGIHKIEIAVYDAQGREVLRAARTQNYADTTAGASFGYRFGPEDAPGQWRVALALDDQPLAERRIDVMPFGSAR